jgi:hypothetical protein
MCRNEYGMVNCVMRGHNSFIAVMMDDQLVEGITPLLTACLNCLLGFACLL